MQYLVIVIVADCGHEFLDNRPQVVQMGHFLVELASVSLVKSPIDRGTSRRCFIGSLVPAIIACLH